MREYLFKYKLSFLIAVLLTAIQGVTFVFVGILIQEITDTSLSGDMEAFKDIVPITILFLTFFLVITYLSLIQTSKYMEKTVTKLKDDIVRGILSKNHVDFKSNETSIYVSTLTNDIKMVEDGYFQPAVELIPNIVTIITAVCALIYLNLIVAGVIVTTSLMIVFIPKVFGDKLVKAQNNVSSGLSEYNNVLKETFMGYDVIKSSDSVSEFSNIVANQNGKLEVSKDKSRRTMGFVVTVGYALSFFSQFSGILLASYFVIIGDMTIGGVVAMSQIANAVFNPLKDINTTLSSQKSLREINKKLFDLTTVTKENKTNENLDFTGIKISNLSYGFEGSRSNIIDGIDFEFKRCKKYAIIGKSGSGKSTFIKLLMGQDSRYSGKVEVVGTDVKLLCNEDISKTISYIGQEVYIFNSSIKDNILLYKDYSKKEYECAIKQSGLKELINSFPERDLYFVGEGGQRLSGGQKQRIAIARSLIRNTDVIISDESTASLDINSAREVEDIMLNLKDKTIINVTHNVNSENMNKYDEILLIDNGKISCHGTLKQLLKDFGSMKSLLSKFETR